MAGAVQLGAYALALGGKAMSLHATLSRLLSRPGLPQRKHRSRWGRLILENLEDRTLLSTFTVINTNDSGAGSLRQALLQANAQTGSDTIKFTIPGGGVHTITPTSGLPIITD